MENLSSEKSKPSLGLYLGILLAVLVIIYVLHELISRPFELIRTNYDCKINGCDFSIVIRNDSTLSKSGYARINAFMKHSVSKSDRKISTGSEKFEFSLKPKEEKTLTGFVKTSAKSSILQVVLHESK